MPLYVKGSSLQEKCFKWLEKRKHLGNKSYCFQGNGGG